MPNNPKRLYSLDVLRGFDMFWIMGAEEILHQLAKVFPNTVTETLSHQFEHPAWHGFAAYDLIFPTFLFIAGVAAPFSIGRDVQQGINRRELAFRALKRGGLLVLLGIIYNLDGFQLKAFHEIRFASVLGHIGVAWALATIIFIYATHWQQMVYVAVGILLGYWALLYFGHATSFSAGDLSMEGNVISAFDRQFLPGRMHKIIHDPEGWLSKIPAITTALLGIGSGLLLRTESLSSTQKIQRLLGLSTLLICLGLVWNIVLPINKNLWTSSFACLAGGISMFLLAIFYYLVDVKGYRGWLAFFFSVIGMNSILIYMSDAFIDWEYTAKAFFGWVDTFFNEKYEDLILVITILAVKWAFLWFMYRKKVFLKV